jgi:putative DNA primase/helicase
VRFIQSIWGADRQAIDLVHEILGYLLSGRTDLQKIFLFIGPPRGGKGTVFRLIKRIFRDQAAAFKINRLENEFGLQSLLGRVVAYDQDVRAASGRMKSPGQVVERLLGISGEDEQTIPRKNLEDLILTLGVRLMLGTNPPFSLGDVTGALATRLVLLEFPTSFLGKEETDLDDALAAELPQIVDLALEALNALAARGRFVEPDSSKEERAALERLTNPMLGFLEDRCVVEAGAAVACSDLYRAAQAWRAEEGHKDMSSGTFAEFLRVRGIKKERTQIGTGKARKFGPRSYIGIRLRVPTDETDPE